MAISEACHGGRPREKKKKLTGDDARGGSGVNAVVLTVGNAVDAAVQVGVVRKTDGTAAGSAALAAPERAADRVAGRVGSFNAGQTVAAGFCSARR